MKFLTCTGLMLLLSACGAGQTPPPAPTIQQVMAVACVVDGVAQPIGAAVLGGLVPEASAGITVDQAAVHPAVVRYCANLGGTPSPATVQTTVTPAAPAAPAPAAKAPAAPAPAAPAPAATKKP